MKAWHAVFAQDPGARAEQQDHGGAWPSPDGTCLFAVLADGAGGHHGGERASRAAVEAARALWAAAPPAPHDFRGFLDRVSEAAHEAIAREATFAGSSRAAWAALVAGAEEAAWVHSGDSRLYHFRAGRLLSRTRDHSVVQVLVDRGRVAEADVPTHPDRSVLLQSLGGAGYTPVEFGSAQLEKDDVFLLCTDGVWMELPEADLAKIARAPGAQREALAGDAVARAVQAGGKKADNASLWCIFSAPGP